jgi:hypothetical protein
MSHPAGVSLGKATFTARKRVCRLSVGGPEGGRGEPLVETRSLRAAKVKSACASMGRGGDDHGGNRKRETQQKKGMKRTSASLNSANRSSRASPVTGGSSRAGGATLDVDLVVAERGGSFLSARGRRAGNVSFREKMEERGTTHFETVDQERVLRGEVEML